MWTAQPEIPCLSLSSGESVRAGSRSASFSFHAQHPYPGGGTGLGGGRVLTYPHSPKLPECAVTSFPSSSGSCGPVRGRATTNTNRTLPVSPSQAPCVASLCPCSDLWGYLDNYHPHFIAGETEALSDEMSALNMVASGFIKMQIRSRQCSAFPTSGVTSESHIQSLHHLPPL